MARGQALLVGLKSVDPASYQGWDGTSGCWGCELDVDNIERILEPHEFSITSIRTPNATADKIVESLRGAAESLSDGDVFTFYFSGHGGQQPDFGGDELDGHDETLVLYDRELVDDELNVIWVSFRPGVRVVMLSDSCNSGTNYRMRRDLLAPTPIEPITEGIQSDMKAQMIHMGGCRDSSTSAGYLGGGAFTMALCNAWAGGGFEGTYKDLFKATAKGVHTGQQPQYNEYGPVSSDFRRERPFTV